jgi:hypothetical protein
MPERFRKRPVVVEAMQWDGVSKGTVRNFVGPQVDLTFGYDDRAWMNIQTLEGPMTARAGDWIIKGVQGEFYPCKPDIFEATYEPVGDDES